MTAHRSAFLFLCAAWLLASPALADERAFNAALADFRQFHRAEMPTAVNCSQVPAAEQQFRAPVTIFLDMHGGVGELANCREIAFTLDFSKVDLVRDYPDLLRQMAVSSGVTLQPIDLRVQGYFAAARDRGRRVLMVTHIDSWRRSDQPPLFLRSH
jgi:hypothetical protein